MPELFNYCNTLISFHLETLKINFAENLYQIKVHVLCLWLLSTIIYSYLYSLTNSQLYGTEVQVHVTISKSLIIQIKTDPRSFQRNYMQLRKEAPLES